MTVYELRQYTLQSGVRDDFVALFDQELVEPQEAAGMRIVGQFRDLDRPDMFVWIRAFADMPARLASLTAFYGGPVWAAHREAANGMMIDSDDVLLLTPAVPVRSETSAGDSLISVSAYLLRDAAALDLCCAIYRDAIEPSLVRAGGTPLAVLRTLDVENTFPRLPVRAGEHAFVTVTRFAADAVIDAPVVPDVMAGLLVSDPQAMRLAPTSRSALR